MYSIVCNQANDPAVTWRHPNLNAEVDNKSVETHYIHLNSGKCLCSSTKPVQFRSSTLWNLFGSRELLKKNPWQLLRNGGICGWWTIQPKRALTLNKWTGESIATSPTSPWMFLHGALVVKSFQNFTAPEFRFMNNYKLEVVGQIFSIGQIKDFILWAVTSWLSKAEAWYWHWGLWIHSSLMICNSS